MLPLKKFQALVPSIPGRSVDLQVPATRTWRCRTLGDSSPAGSGWKIDPLEVSSVTSPEVQPDLALGLNPDEVDPLYLFACHIEWEHSEEPSAGWELISAAQSSHSETRAHARALLSCSRHLGGIGLAGESPSPKRRPSTVEAEMKAPYGLDIVEDCTECNGMSSGRFCEFSQTVLASLSKVSHKSVLPAGAILFVEGQASRGMFIVCAGKVNLSTTSREGKILILKTAGPGEAVGLSAAVSGMTYETTAETSTPCHLNFVDRKHFLELMQTHSEIGLHTAQSLSRDYQSAYHDIHDLVLTRSSSGKLARLLLSQSRQAGENMGNFRTTPMTHEEMAMRIGASRETVTRLLSELRRRHLILLDGPTLVIRDRTALEALAV